MSAEQEREQQLLGYVCGSDTEARDWLQRAIQVLHLVDDLVDEQTQIEFRIRTVVKAMELYVHPYFLKHGTALHPVLRSIANRWADSVAWEHSTAPEEAAWAEHARHAGLDLMLTVADLVGGWDHVRNVSPIVRQHNLQVAASEQQQEQPKE